MKKLIEKENILFCILYLEGEDNEDLLKKIKDKGIEKITKIIKIGWDLHYINRIGILEIQGFIEPPVLIAGLLLKEEKKAHELCLYRGSKIWLFINSIK